MPLIYQRLLDQISAMRKQLDLGIRPGCTAQDLADLQTRARKELGVEIPPGYADFLRQHDGLNWNGLFVYASKTVSATSPGKGVLIEGFMDANLDFRSNGWESEWMLFGDSSLDLYVFNPAQNKYMICDRTSLDETESYTSFEEMIAEALRIHL